MNKKVTLFNFDGSPRETYDVSIEVATGDGSTAQKKKLGHQIIVVDRSGSMWHDIEALKDTVIKVLTLNEFADSDMLVSLISYSSKGDVTLHFERVPVSKVMKAGSEHLQEIKKIRATFLTCASQAMDIADELINDEEVTGIILHSDGYANDPSPYMEGDQLEKICNRLSKKDVFVNTIAYSNYSDFILLSKVANSVSGTCVKANDTRAVYEAIEESCKILSEGTAATIEVDVEDSDYVVFLSKEPCKIIGSEEDMVIKGVADAKYCIVRFRKTDIDAKAVANDAATRMAMQGMARAKLAAGSINEAKMAMMSSMNKTVTEQNIKALTANQLAEMAKSLEQSIFTQSPAEFYEIPGLENEGSSILDLVHVLHSNRSEILLNVSKIKSNYKKRGLKKNAGKREADGSITIPDVDTKLDDGGDFIKMGKFDINRDTATINMQVERRTKLVKRGSGEVISEVAGILLDNLIDYKKYTIVGDGEVNLSSLFVRFSTKNAFNAVKELGILTGEKYSHTTEYELELSEMPVCRLVSDAVIPSDVFDRLGKLNIIGRIITGLAKGKSSNFSEEQIDELKSHCLSDSLYINIPMMNEHDDLDEAIKTGSVDSRTSYKITIGNTNVLNVGKFKSANAFLDRMYVSYGAGSAAIKKAKLAEVFFDKDVSFGHKQLSSRTKVTQADNLQKAIYDEVLGLSSPDFLKEIGALIDIPEIVDLRNRLNKTPDELIDIISKVKRAVADKERELWATLVSPVVFHIGSTGILPDGMDSIAMTAEELLQKHSHLNLSKAEKEGTFFEIDGIILSVYASKAYFSTGLGRS